MYGADAYGSIPYGASSFGPEDVFDVDAMLASSREEFVVTVVLTTWHTAEAEEHIHYYASKEWATEPDDYPASQPFDGRFSSYSFSRSMNNGDRFGGIVRGEGQIVLVNADGELDEIVDTHAVDSREAVVRVGRVSDPLVDHPIVFRGVAVDILADVDTVTITVRDKSFLLDVPSQPTTYLGTGDEEGGTGLTGKRKPVLYGHLTGVPPVLVDSSLLIYQVHDGSLEPPAGVIGSPSIFPLDRGTDIDTGTEHASYAALASASVSAGFVDTWPGGGFFRLGSTPDGIVLTIAGFAEEDPWPASRIVLDIVESAAELDDADINHSRFDAAILEQPAPLGYFIGPDNAVTVADAITAVMTGVGGWCAFNRNGELEIGIFTAPSGDPVAYFDRDEGDIIDFNREKLPSGIWPPPWRWRLAYDWRVQTFDDFAGAVSDGIRERYSEPYALAVAEDAAVLTDHPLAQDPGPVESHFVYEQNAQDEADRLIALYTAGYNLYRMTLTRRALQLEIGDVIHVTHSRFGLSAGKLLRIVSIDDRIQIGDGGGGIQVEITAFG